MVQVLIGEPSKMQIAEADMAADKRVPLVKIDCNELISSMHYMGTYRTGYIGRAGHQLSHFASVKAMREQATTVLRRRKVMQAVTDVVRTWWPAVAVLLLSVRILGAHAR